MLNINPANLSETAKFYLAAITNKGKLRASKPKDGVAAYVWRMVAFSLSTNPQHHCMPMTADFGITEKSIPEYWLPEAPESYITEKVAKTNSCPDDVEFCLKHASSVEEYHRKFWVKYDRRNYWIKLTLDPVVKEIVDSVPVQNQPGTMRWVRVFS